MQIFLSTDVGMGSRADEIEGQELMRAMSFSGETGLKASSLEMGMAVTIEIINSNGNQIAVI